MANVKVFDPAFFDGKRVAVVGPASSAFNTGRGKFIDGFDVVVRMNKSPFVVDKGAFVIDIGARTDVLFHCFHENPVGGGGPIDFGLYDRAGIKYVVNPRNEFTGLRNTFNFYKKYLQPTTTYLLPRRIYDQISKSVEPYRPTTGYSALSAILLSSATELYVTGFTFFKTAYGEGYRDEMREAAQAQKFIEGVGLHNPDSELQGFKRILAHNNCGSVVLDAELSDILKRY